MPPKESPYGTLESWMAIQIIAGPINQALQAIECYEQERYDTFKPRPIDRKSKKNTDASTADHYINELDLRKILSQYLHNYNSDSNMVDVFIHQLPSSLPADGMHFFRRFKVDDVYNSLASLMDI